MLRRVALMLTLAAIAAVVLIVGAGGAPATEGKTIYCVSGKVCQGTTGNDLIYGSQGGDNIRPGFGDDYVIARAGPDEVGHSGGDDRILGGRGSDTVRGGFGLDVVYGNVPEGWHPANITDLTSDDLAYLSQGYPDVSDDAHDLIDCAYLISRGDPGPDEGFGEPRPLDTVVDCSNRDDQ